MSKDISYQSICAIAEAYEHSLTIDKVTYAMTGDLECAAVLSRLRYWFGPGKDGRQRTRILKEGKVWMARKDEEWEEEACVRARQVPRVKRALKKLGLVEVKVFKFDNETVSHWHLDKEAFTRLYNDALQNMILETHDASFPDCANGDSRTTQSDISYNKHIRQASKTGSLPKHMGGCAEDASFDEEYEDMSGKPPPPKLYGKAKLDYNSLSEDQKRAFKAITGMEPINDTDQPFNAVEALKIVRERSHQEIVDAIEVYEQRLQRGAKPKGMAPYLLSIIRSRVEPMPPHADENRQCWEENKDLFEGESYEQGSSHVRFPDVDDEVSYRMAPEEFRKHLNQIYQKLQGVHDEDGNI